MLEVVIRFFSNIVERTEGPMSLRFFLQPTMSLVFAIIAAVKDAKSGTEPYLFRYFTQKENRKAIAKEAWKDIRKIFIIAAVLDIVYQLIMIFKFKTEAAFYPIESIFVAFLLALIPYLLFRGPINRLVRMFMSKSEL